MKTKIVKSKESLLDLEIKRIEQAFVEKEKQLQKMKIEAISQARHNGILQGIDKLYLAR